MSANRAGFTLVIDGVDYASAIVPRLNSLSLTEKLGGEADTLELTLSNHDGALTPIRRGVVASLALGWESGDGVPVGLVDKGRFKVDEVPIFPRPVFSAYRAAPTRSPGGLRKTSPRRLGMAA